jgi:hypothetical protein
VNDGIEVTTNELLLSLPETYQNDFPENIRDDLLNDRPISNSDAIDALPEEITGQLPEGLLDGISNGTDLEDIIANLDITLDTNENDNIDTGDLDGVEIP